MANPFFNVNILDDIRLIVKMVIIELDCVIKQIIMPVKKLEKIVLVNLFKMLSIKSLFSSSIVFPSLLMLCNNKKKDSMMIKKDLIFIFNYMYKNDFLAKRIKKCYT